MSYTSGFKELSTLVLVLAEKHKFPILLVCLYELNKGVASSEEFYETLISQGCFDERDREKIDEIFGKYKNVKQN